ncbi:hypothetical protein GCM10009836_42760 [Pseudonocardia ailaonensis]|uniref:HD domain-containing protein n=1 Tax=Pseudonocardia ailaonensis TaxID=367279 RepID=A0ABN2N9Z4_9PSEU
MTTGPLGHSRDDVDESVVAQVVGQIPAIGRITDRALRDAVALTWACSWRESGYTGLDEVLQGQGPITLLHHVNGVDEQATALTEQAETTYGLAVDHDVVLAAAVLHDVDKPLLWTSSGASVTFRPGRTLADHGILGAELAALCGVPERVRAIVRGHSPYSDRMEDRRSPEAALVYHADNVVAALDALSVGLTPACGLTKLVPAPC